MEAPKEIFIEQEHGGFIHRKWLKNEEIPQEKGCTSIKYHHDSQYQKAVEALKKLARLGNGDRLGNSLGNDIAIRALKELGEIE